MYDVVVMRTSRSAPIASAMKTPERTPAQLPTFWCLFEDPAISKGKKTEMLRAMRGHAHLRTPKSQKQFVNTARAAMAGDRLTADAATMTISSPTRSPRVADLRRQLEFAAAKETCTSRSSWSRSSCRNARFTRALDRSPLSADADTFRRRYPRRSKRSLVPRPAPPRSRGRWSCCCC